MQISELINKFIDTIEQDNRILIMTHDNPDPDSISSAAALRYIIMQKIGKRPTIGYGGIIGRAENIVMYEELDIRLTPVSELEITDYDRIVLVDCQPEAGNSPVYNSKIPVSMTIDHHPKHTEEPNSDFLYLNDMMGATASILTYYIMENDIEIPKKLATALFYGIKSETQNLAREAGRIDKKAYEYLFPRIDNVSLSKIENPTRTVEFFHILGRVVRSALVYDDNTIICNLEEVSVPDLVPQIADMILNLQDMEWSMVTGNVDDLIYISMRTRNPENNANKIIKKTVQKDGTCGGHGMMAGGRLETIGKSKTEVDSLVNALKTRFLDAVKVKAKRGKRLLVEKKKAKKSSVAPERNELAPSKSNGK